MSDFPRNETTNLRGRASSGARWMAAAKIVRVATQFVQLLILARLLEPGDFGLMAMVTVVTVFGNVFADVGIGSAIIHFQEATRRQLSTLYWLNVLCGLTVFAVVQLGAPLAARVFDEPDVVGLLRTASIMFLVMPIGQQFQFLLERELRFTRVAIFEIAAVLVSATVAITAAHAGKGAYSLVWGVLAFHASMATLVTVDGVRTWRPSPIFRPSECRPMLRFGLYLVGERTLNLTGQQLDKFILAILVDRETLGYYSLAYNLVARAYQMINPVFTRVAYPVFSRVKHDLARLETGFLELMSVISSLTMPLFAAVLVLAEPVVRVQFGPGYEPCIPLLRIFALLGALFSLGNPMGSLMLARGRAELTFAYNGARVLLYAGAAWIGSRWGVEGVAWALVVVTGGILHAAAFGLRWAAARIRPVPYLSAVLPFAVTAAVSAAGVWWLFATIRTGNAVADLVLFALLLVAVYLLTLLAWQRERVRRIVRLARS